MWISRNDHGDRLLLWKFQGIMSIEKNLLCRFTGELWPVRFTIVTTAIFVLCL